MCHTVLGQRSQLRLLQPLFLALLAFISLANAVVIAMIESISFAASMVWQCMQPVDVVSVMVRSFLHSV
eukprot:COSAG02_NODE_65788_length_257_cov_0.651899_1_plen_68_part_01